MQILPSAGRYDQAIDTSAARYLGYGRALMDALVRSPDTMAASTAGTMRMSLYGLSYAYMGYDVLRQGMRENNRAGATTMGVARATAYQAAFQSIASFALPLMIFRGASSVGKNMLSNVSYARYGPAVAVVAGAHC